MLIGKPILDPLTSEALSLEPEFAQTGTLISNCCSFHELSCQRLITGPQTEAIPFWFCQIDLPLATLVLTSCGNEQVHVLHL